MFGAGQFVYLPVKEMNQGMCIIHEIVIDILNCGLMNERYNHHSYEAIYIYSDLTAEKKRECIF